MSEKPKTSEGNKIGLAALIASIGIPLAQLAVGYLQQYTTQQQNAVLETERRRLEITKLFLDNYIGKKTDVQIATIQIMKALDPSFFIAIEDGLKETSHSDSVKASIRRATIDAATEISYKTPLQKSAKLKRVLSSNELEAKAKELLQKGDTKNAQKYFDQANEAYPMYKTQPSVSSSSISQQEMNALQKKMDKELEKKMEKMKRQMEKQ